MIVNSNEKRSLFKYIVVLTLYFGNLYSALSTEETILVPFWLNSQMPLFSKIKKITQVLLRSKLMKSNRLSIKHRLKYHQVV